MALTSAAPQAPSKPRFKMQLNDDGFMVEYGGRVPKGGVVIVDEDTAIRWLENNIAIQVSASTPTHREAKRAEAARKLVRDEVVNEQEAGVYDQMISRESPRMPASRRTKAREVRLEANERLIGAGVINTAADDDDPEMVVPGEE